MHKTNQFQLKIKTGPIAPPKTLQFGTDQLIHSASLRLAQKLWEKQFTNARKADVETSNEGIFCVYASALRGGGAFVRLGKGSHEGISYDCNFQLGGQPLSTSTHR